MLKIFLVSLMVCMLTGGLKTFGKSRTTRVASRAILSSYIYYLLAFVIKIEKETAFIICYLYLVRSSLVFFAPAKIKEV